MKLAVIHNLRFGGAHRRLSAQLKIVSRAFEVVEYTLSTADPVTSEPVVLPLSRVAPDAPRWIRPPLRYFDLATLLAAYRRLRVRVMKDQPDVIWANPCQFLQAPWVANTGIPSVYYCDEPRRYDYEQVARRSVNPSTQLLYGPMRQIERLADRRSTAQFHALLTNSRYTAFQIAAAYGRCADVVTCGVSPTFHQGKPEAMDNEYALSVGSMIPTKGHDLAIDAVAGSGLDIGLTIVSSRFDAAEAQRLEARARDAHVSLRILTGISDEQLRQLYQGAVATLYLARAEPFGLVSVEAQRCGCPVVVANEGGLPETLIDGETGFAVARAATPAGAALRKIADSDTRRAMGEAASTFAASFSWEQSGNSVSEALMSVIP